MPFTAGSQQVIALARIAHISTDERRRDPLCPRRCWTSGVRPGRHSAGRTSGSDHSQKKADTYPLTSSVSAATPHATRTGSSVSIWSRITFPSTTIPKFPELEPPFAGDRLLEAYRDEALLLGMDWFLLYDDPALPYVFTDPSFAESIARANLGVVADHLGQPALADLPLMYVEVEPGMHLLQVPMQDVQELEPAVFDLVMLALPERRVAFPGQ